MRIDERLTMLSVLRRMLADYVPMLVRLVNGQRHDGAVQIVISGFAGMLTSWLCWYMTAPIPLAGFMAGTAGFMGSRALELYERRFQSWSK